MPQKNHFNVRTARSSVVTSLAIAELTKTETRGNKILQFAYDHKAVSVIGVDEHHPKQNQLLSSLPSADYERLLPHLALVPMAFGATLSQAGMPMQYAYFPTNCVVSLLCDTQDGTSVETAIVGKDGLIGVTLLMGETIGQGRAVIKSAGYGYRLNARILKEEFGLGGVFQQVLLRYTQALLAQTSQTAVCNRHHTIIQQLCRWFLLSLDRLPTNELKMTQELIANLLGVRRESITQAVEVLQKEGLIAHWRGHIVVTNRPGLEHKACECYSAVKKVYDRLLPEKDFA